MTCYHTNPYFSSFNCVALIRFYNYYNQLLSAFIIVLIKSLNVSLLSYIVNLFLYIDYNFTTSSITYIYVNTFGSLPLVSIFCVSLNHFRSRKNKSFNAQPPEFLATFLVLISLALLCQIVVDISLIPTIHKFVIVR